MSMILNNLNKIFFLGFLKLFFLFLLSDLPLHEMDTNLMFEKFTIQEIREIEKKNR